MSTPNTAGIDANWAMFVLAQEGGSKVIVRSRAAHPEVASYAIKHVLARVRCNLKADLVRDDGMPNSTAPLDDYEDELIRRFEQEGLPSLLVAVVTGEGRRDLFFAVENRADLIAVIEAARAERPFSLQVGWIEGSAERVVSSLMPRQGSS